jgi:hypothetical protein
MLSEVVAQVLLPFGDSYNQTGISARLIVIAEAKENDRRIPSSDACRGPPA